MNAFRTALAVLLIAAPTLASDILVPRGATWTYLDDGSDQGAAWRAPGFDDSSWSLGSAQLGYGDGDEATVVGFGPSSNNKYVTTYFRHAFNVPNPGAYTTLKLDLVRDDGAVVYLNGTEVARSEMPGGVISFTTLAASTAGGSEEDVAIPFSPSTGLLVPGPNVIAVEVHQRDVTSSDISMDVQLEACTGLCLERGPYLQVGTHDAMTVRWRTDFAADGLVRWGLAPDQLTQALVDVTQSVDHEFRITGLAPESTYYYSIGSTSGVLAGGDAEHAFTTAPLPGTVRPVRIWATGDGGTSDAFAAAVRDAYLGFPGPRANVWLMLGDNAYDEGRDEEYQSAVFDMYPQVLRETALWPTRGNHEDFASVYYGIFTMPSAGEAGGLPSGSEAYYSFDHANVHFVCLDSEGTNRSVNGPMWLWCQADLAATDQDWIVVYWHHPPYTKGSHDSDTESNLVQMRQNFLPMLEAGGSDLVLSGHSHAYERSFLLNGHYGLSTTLTPAMILDDGDGNVAGDGAYTKAEGVTPGTVYTVAGSSGKLTSGPLNHPAMVLSLFEYGSVVIDVNGGRMDVMFLQADGQVGDAFTMLKDPYSYCSGKLNSLGCVPFIGTAGAPSVSSTAPFTVSASDLLPSQAGFLIYGTKKSNLAFHGGRLCVKTPFARLLPPKIAKATGALPCTGRLSRNFNARIQSGADPTLTAGAVVRTQWFQRDPADPAGFGDGLTNAVSFTIAP